jgi:hypothetical protein
VTLLYRAVLPFIGLLVIALILTTYIPSMSTWLPSFIETEEMPDLQQAPLPDEAGGEGGEGGIDLDDLMGDDFDDLGLGPDAGAGGGDIDLDDLEGGDDIDLDDLEGGGDDITLDDLEGGGD